MEKRFEGKAAVVTGAGRGIGRGIAMRLAQEGAAVCVNYSRSAEMAASAVAEIEKAGGRAFAYQADVARSDQVQAMVDETARRYGRLDIVVANAGSDARYPFLDITEADWDALIATNIKGTFLVCQAGAREMVKAGGGKIVIISSIHSMVSYPGMVAYATSKGAQVAMARTMALDLAVHNINVNSIAVGRTVRERDFEQNPNFDLHMFDDIIPVGRQGQPADIGAVVAFLCSEDASFMTGALVAADGGLSATNYFQGATRGPVRRRR